MRIIRFLHVVKDDKFTAPVKKSFDNDAMIASEYIHYCWRKHLKYLDKEPYVSLYYKSKDFKKRLQKNDYDVLYLHSLHFSVMRFLKYVPSDKIVIWWAWGGDIYDGQLLGLKSYVHIDTLKPITKKVIIGGISSRRIKNLLTGLLFSIPFTYYRKQALKRIDYFQPVIDVDYALMKRFTKFNVQEYYPNNWSNFYTGTEKCEEKDPRGAILLGNSAAPANNHLDAWEFIKKEVSSDRLVILPLSYGAMDYARKVKEEINDKKHNTRFLDTFIPFEEYYKLIGQCSYAVYGSIRQHAMGNIYNALRNGLKVFLFKDSYIFQYLVQKGFVVFAIDDVNAESFNKPLSREEHMKNLDAMKCEIMENREKAKSAMDSIIRRVENNTIL
jgi:hypothetical protein